MYRELESHDWVIVGEDHDTGDRSWLGEAVLADSVDDVIAGLVQARFSRVSGSTGAFSSERADLTTAMAVGERADVVAAFIRDLDEAPLWDLADQHKSLRTQGLALRVRTHVGVTEAITAARELAAPSASDASTQNIEGVGR